MLTTDFIDKMQKKEPRFLSFLKHKCERSFLDFIRVMFPLCYGIEFEVNRHHEILCATLESVFAGKIKRLCIDIPPGYGKTEIVVVMWSAWCIAKQPRSRFMHTSYSEDLALGNSSKVKDVIEHPIFQRMWPMSIRRDTTAKKMWTIEETNGMFIAVPISGQITGRRAGVLGLKTFSGALIIDDPVKPDDVHSVTLREKVNRKFKSTIRNRIATESVPIVIIMQRLHKLDLVGFLLGGGTKEEWHHLSMPALVPKRHTHGKRRGRGNSHAKPIRYEYPEGALWSTKHTIEDLEKIRLADAYVYGAQYAQNPISLGMTLFKERWWRYASQYNANDSYVIIDDQKVFLEYKMIFADTAMKKEERHDYSVFQCWGKLSDRKAIVLLDQKRDKWEAPELEEEFIEFINYHSFDHMNTNVGLRSIHVEDKASGIGLIQTINSKINGHYIEGIPRNKDKVSRAKSCMPSVKRGEVYLLDDADYLVEYIAEFTEFNVYMTHAHDDQVDPTLDAIDRMLVNDTGGYSQYV